MKIREERTVRWSAIPQPDRLSIRGWAVWMAVVTLAFVQPLYDLLMLTKENSLHSHIPLVPFIAGYMLFTNRDALPRAGRSSLTGAILLGVIGITSVGSAIMLTSSLSSSGRVALLVFAYVTLVAAGGFLFFGSRWMAAAAFPLAFLLFMVPLPDAVVIWLEDALVLASADVSAWMIAATGTPLLRNGTIFTLPTIVLEVARECSGIRSTWVLFITSIVASHVFLESPLRRLVLVLFVIPLGVIRNGFRILTIALLCVQIGPHMIDSVIHHRGGPIFFALSLVPLFLLLTWLRRSERTTTRERAGSLPV